MKRRDFITLLGGAAAWPLAAHAQQGARVRRIGVLVPFAEDHPVGQGRVAAFLQGLQQLGWTDGRNVRIDYRWSAGEVDRTRKFANELIALGPDVVMAFTSAAVAPLREATSTVPIVFAVVADPVGAGYVESLARPGGNVTGFAAQDYARLNTPAYIFETSQRAILCPCEKQTDPIRPESPRNWTRTMTDALLDRPERAPQETSTPLSDDPPRYV